ncbi:MAG: S8 family serine peptidase, partial [Bacteroidota bacterium]|nr:S8 family serine peptidase [Bacteroidota bacterium]
MRKNPIPLIAGLLLFSFMALAQKNNDHTLLLKSGPFTPEKNISAAFVDQFNRRAGKIEDKSFSIIQFEHIPTDEERNQMSAAGIQLLDYIPNNAYTVSFSGKINISVLEKVKARSLVELKAEQKMQPFMAKGIFPSWAVKTPGTVDVWISFPKTISFETLSLLLQQRNFNIISTDFKKYNVIALRIAAQRLTELASLPFVEYVEPSPPGDQPLNNISRNNSRANVLNASIGSGGRSLKGEGVVIGVGDNSDPQSHVDFTGRLMNHAAALFDFHGTHTHGIVGGGGIISEQYAGYAPKAKLVSQVFSGILTNAPAYVQDYGMVVTNNSYGAIVDDCNYNGLYDLYSRILDKQAFDLPNLEHVFAVGNSGRMNCPPYPTGFKTVIGGYQAAKNVLTVGNTYGADPLQGVLYVSSSKGPTQDGRTKPEIVAQGMSVISTVNSGPYGSSSGTSMSSPAVAGGLGLLYQRY